MKRKCFDCLVIKPQIKILGLNLICLALDRHIREKAFWRVKSKIEWTIEGTNEWISEWTKWMWNKEQGTNEKTCNTKCVGVYARREHWQNTRYFRDNTQIAWLFDTNIKQHRDRPIHHSQNSKRHRKHMTSSQIGTACIHENTQSLLYWQ